MTGVRDMCVSPCMYMIMSVIQSIMSLYRMDCIDMTGVRDMCVSDQHARQFDRNHRHDRQPLVRAHLSVVDRSGGEGG